MALLERVATLLRANVNDMLDRAEDPPVMLKQLLRDMENQLLQVKTQVAVALADQHLLEARCAEYEESARTWRSSAELALSRNDEPLARAAAERCLQAEELLGGYRRQLADQCVESELLRQQYRQLEQKLGETSREGELLLTALRRGTHRRPAPEPPHARGVLRRVRDTVLLAEATSAAERAVHAELASSVDDRLARLEQERKVDALLAGLRGSPRALEG